MRTAPLSRLLAAVATLLLASAALPSAAAVAQSPVGRSAVAQSAAADIPVQAAAAARQDVPVLLRAIGSVQAYQTVLVRARVDGTLDRVLFQEGQTVRAGDKLALIDPRPYAAALAQAQAKKASDEAMLANAQRELGRTTNLARSEFASRQQLDTQGATVAQAQAAIAGDQAAVDTAKLNLDFCTITSPIEGRAGLRLVDAGNLVHANDAQGLVSIAQIRPIAVLFTVPQDSLPAVQAAMAGGAVPVRAFASDDRTPLGEGRLLTMDNAIDATTGTIRLKAEFANTEAALWPGQFLNVHLQVDTLRGVVTVPSAAVQRGPNGLYVFLVRADQTVAMQPVEVRQDDAGVAVVAKGIEDGARVVTAGQSRLQDGSRVAVAARPAG